MNGNQRTVQRFGHRTSISIVGLFSLVLTLAWNVQYIEADPEIPSNWRVEEVASHPSLKSPLAVEVAPDGRVFVGEARTKMIDGSREEKTEPIERLLRFHPDGRRAIVAEGFHGISGLLYLDGKLYVNHPPKLSVLSLKGDEVTERRELLDLGPDHLAFFHHFPAQLRLGMDGFIYMSLGDKGIRNVEGTDGSSATLHGGGLLRFRPDGSGLEIFAKGTRNHLDIAINSRDELFVYDNDDGTKTWHTRVMHIVDGGDYGYPFEFQPREPHILPKIKSYGGGSPTGATAYTGARLPEKYHDNLFMCEYGKLAVFRYKMRRSGGTFRIDDRKRFMQHGGGDPFRPVGIAQAMDGVSFFVTDWDYNGWSAGTHRGQLFKVTYTGSTRSIAIPDWFERGGRGKPLEVSTNRLIEEGLKHPAKRVRQVAQRQLARRGQAAVSSIVEMLTSSEVPEHAKWHGIWTLDAIDGGRSTRDSIIDLTGSEHAESARGQAIRQLGIREVKRAQDVLLKYLDDDNASIRFRAATALGRIGNPDALEPLLETLDDSDQFVRHAVSTALNRIGRSNPEAFHQIAMGFNADRKLVRTGTKSAMRETYMVQNVKALADIVRNGSTIDARGGALKTLVPLFMKPEQWDGTWWGTVPIKHGPPPHTRSWKGTSIVRSVLESVVKDKSMSLKKVLVRSGSKLRTPKLIPLFRDLFQRTENRKLKKSVLNTLTKIPDKRALPTYLEGLSKEDEQVRASSRDALRAISSSVRGEVMKRARSGAFTDEELQQLAQVFTKPEPVRNWHIIGPFERERTRPFDLKSVPYEQTFEGETGRVAWREATGEEKHGHIDLEEELEETDHASAFARATVEVEEAMDTELVLGSDDGLRVWVNGEKVFEDMGTRGWEPDQFRVPVSLKKGKNEIVCKIEENTGSWGFSVKYVSRGFLRRVQEQ